MKAYRVLLVAMAVGCALAVGCSLAGREFGPSALLKKYEWFKDAAAQLDAKRATIELYKARAAGMERAYAGRPRREWAREDREQMNLWEQELAGLKASYNALAAEWNAAMAKENYRFCNVGELPRGASAPLPREFRQYRED